jgi:formylglycine-generating enzyme required for sulfatase activity
MAGGSRVFRGGAWDDAANGSRLTTGGRNSHAPSMSHVLIGFRVVCDYRPPVISNSIGMKLVRIPAGRFMLGSPKDEPGRDADDEPQRPVTIAKPFYMGVYEVTQAEYEKVTGKNPATFNKAGGGGPDHPVEVVSWNDAVAFCWKLSQLPEEKQAGRRYRLPTEAEWEYACRAGTRTAFSFGDDAAKLGDYAWYEDNSRRTTQPVGRKLPNPWGLYDMHGNLGEVTEEITFRGAGYRCKALWCRSASRHSPGAARDFRTNEDGFRVVCDHRSP